MQSASHATDSNFVAFDPANSAAPGSLELGRERLQATRSGPAQLDIHH